MVEPAGCIRVCPMCSLWTQVSSQYLVPVSWCSAAGNGPSGVTMGEVGKGEPEGGTGEDSCDGKEERGVKDLLKQIADVSEEVTKRSGLTFDDQSGMYYDAQSGLYYDQVGQLNGWRELHASLCTLNRSQHVMIIRHICSYVFVMIRNAVLVSEFHFTDASKQFVLTPTFPIVMLLWRHSEVK